MAFEITIPRLGWSMEEGVFVRWLKQDGDIVKPGEAVFELEGEKAAQDIEAVDAGTLHIPSAAPKPGAVVAVGTVIGYLLAPGEAAPDSIQSPKPNALVQSAPSNESGQQKKKAHVDNPPAAAPSVRRMARERGVDLAQIAGSGPAGRIMPQDLTVPTSVQQLKSITPQSTVASPRARRIARELGIDWTLLPGTGRNGRVRESDVRMMADSVHRTAKTSLDTSSSLSGSSSPITRHRRTIAERMLHSQQHTAPVTLTTRVDATNLVSLRQQFKSAGNDGIVPSYSDIILKLVAMALSQHSSLMAHWIGDQLVIPDRIHIGLAVDTQAGLLVPVVRDVPSLSFVELTKQTSSLIERARAGKLKSTDIQDGVFTITSLGTFGIDTFTPIINYPESAILGLGRIKREPAVHDNQIVSRDLLSLSLTFDHRVIDGAPAARFLQTVGQAIELPSAWLLRDQ